ncbi:hypothetical protein A2627_00060 [Candidatus Woesebacteria bacterium RIFCSPHIGHO2_01_FULL_39_28]|uniref:Uncharacterized protein n=1 Tax=Candidatus Woesebacteria bacterium RIFCSPHIGHO2_01_FULL_39_28 TaxID=1802496 RepID=A0A1F7YG79_9BACT|nr:MAG: hypothetical protein A2627_00060 [Candidatus Woesebacteria bacterium RIFCSPHIGHO2_01_FULL_39_28]OGM58099.1 MAG: hypothetical protein A3A50_04280 [Candidatus Woesebacteria bacterium RIFCSPLOWO2_01_FULL_38_20]
MTKNSKGPTRYQRTSLFTYVLVPLLLITVVAVAFVLNLFQFSNNRSSLDTANSDVAVAKNYISSLSIDGFSDWIFLDKASQIPSNNITFKPSSMYSSIVRRPSVTLSNDKKIVTLFTWTRDSGMLSQWQVTIAGQEVVHVKAEALDVGVGSFFARTEGFVPSRGVVLIDEETNQTNIKSNRQRSEDIQCYNDRDCYCHCCQRSLDSPTSNQLNQECPLFSKTSSEPLVECVFDLCGRHESNFSPKCINSKCIWISK